MLPLRREAREVEETLKRHHLIPRTRHHNTRNKREFAPQTVFAVVGLCGSCHSQLHRLLTEKQLARESNTIAKLRAHPGVAAFVEWIRTKPSGFRPAMRSARTLRATRQTRPVLLVAREF